MTTLSNPNIHVFENANMGKAPFKLIGFYALPSKALAEHNPQAYQNQLAAMPKDVGCGSCTYCSTPLVNHFIILSSDNKKSVVGCDCVAKTGDRGLVDAVKLKQKEINKEKRAAARLAKFEQQRIAHEAELQRQRDTNKGFTDAELLEKKRKALKAKFNKVSLKLVSDLEPLLDAIAPKRANSSFVKDVGRTIADGEFKEVSRNMWRIITEIAAKQTGGRANSKAYHAEYEKYEAMISKAVAKFDKAYDKLTKDLANLK